ncbi:MAG: dynamin family protein [Micromonosporaceae bacterium]
MTTQGDTGVARPDGGNSDSEDDATPQTSPQTPSSVDADQQSQAADRQTADTSARPDDPAPDPAGPQPRPDADGEASAGDADPPSEAEGDTGPAPEAGDTGPAPEAGDADPPSEVGDAGGDVDPVGDAGDVAEDSADSEGDTSAGRAAVTTVTTAAAHVPAPAPTTPMDTLSAALTRLRAALSGTRFGLALPMADEAERQTSILLGQLDDYLLPRLARIDAPMLVVVGGSTGAGKSTLVNSLLRAPVSPAGVLRPTTRSPVLVCHPDDVRWFGEAHLLPDIPRANAVVEAPRETTRQNPDKQRVVSRGAQWPRLQVVTAEELPAGVAFLDAPDIDSVVDANRALAGQLLAAADLWLFLTTAARYADAVPWDVLRDAEERGAAVALVLDRVPDEGRDVVVAHLQQMLVDHGFGDAPLFIVGEQQLDNQRLLPEPVIAPVREWFADLARDAERREAVVRQTLAGAVTSIHPRVDAIAVQADAQRDAAAGLRVTAQNAYAEAESRVEGGLRDGALLRGEVLARWQELVGSGDLTRALETRIGKWRDQLRAAVTGRPLPGRKFQAALTSGTAALIIASAADAAEQTAAQWSTHPAGRALLETPNGDRLRYFRPSPDLEERAEKLVGNWQRWVLELVRTEAGNKRSVARLTAYTVNATGLLVMIGVFASTAFIPTGAEVAVAGGTTLASQKLLEAIFGDQAVRQLAGKAKEHLLDQVRVLLDHERQRYTDLLYETGVDPAAADKLRDASGDVERARIAADLVPTRDALAQIPVAGVAPPAEPEASDGETEGPDGEDADGEDADDESGNVEAAADENTDNSDDAENADDGGEGGSTSTVRREPRTSTRRKR